MTVKFWAFAKRLNSTAQPTASAAYTFSALTLKAESGVLQPVLEIFQSQLWNPSSYNYALIVEYGRYYYVTEWTWVLGHWECQLECDVLATWKTDIGESTMYVLRAASEYDAGIVDTLYPTRYGPRVMFHDSVSFGFDQDLSGAGETSTYSGCYVIGIAANSNGVSSYYTGPVTYWVMSAGQCRHFVDYMLLDYNQAWDQAPSGITDLLYRAVYSPFDYIKSCMWFPISPPLTTNQYITFGSYVSDQVAMRLEPEALKWTPISHDLDLPTGWATYEARDLCQPYAHLYLVFNPFGVIELNPTDFFGASGIRLTIYPDYVSGDCLLKIFAVQTFGQTETAVFVTEQTAKIGVNVNLSSSNVSLSGLIGGASATASGIATASAATGGAAIAAGALAAAGGAASAVSSMLPSPSSSVGQQSGGVRAMEGVADLYYWQSYFAERDNADHGRPLYKSRRLDTLSGYIKVGDSHIEISGMLDEIKQINDYLEGGIYYE